MKYRFRMSTIRHMTFPRTSPPPPYVQQVVGVFRTHESAISTVSRAKGLDSDGVLRVLRADLVGLGWDVELSKKSIDKIHRPVFFGENGAPELQYEVDAYHPDWKCGMEVEAGRGFMGNAFYRDLVQALVMVEVDHLIVGLANAYKHKSGGKVIESRDYEKGCDVAAAVYGHARVEMPYALTIIGY